MHSDVLDLVRFYATPLGKIAKRAIRREIRGLWPNLRGKRLLGLGYATPFLKPFIAEAERVCYAMPATQGVIAWPRGEKNLVTLCDETTLPFEDYSIDCAVVVHALEGCGDARHLLQEIWRVLAGDGRLILIAPNRLGLWAHSDQTPFGNGQPFSTTQMQRLLQQCQFAPIGIRRCLYGPPRQSGLWLSSHRAIEKIGRMAFAKFSGIVMIEARKELIAPLPVRYARYRHVPIPAAAGAPAKGFSKI